MIFVLYVRNYFLSNIGISYRINFFQYDFRQVEFLIQYAIRFWIRVVWFLFTVVVRESTPCARTIIFVICLFQT